MEILCINNNNGIRENKVLVVTTDGAVILKHSVAVSNIKKKTNVLKAFELAMFSLDECFRFKI